MRSEISIGRINSIGRSDRYNYESKQASAAAAGRPMGICIVAGFQVFWHCNNEMVCT